MNGCEIFSDTVTTTVTTKVKAYVYSCVVLLIVSTQTDSNPPGVEYHLVSRRFYNKHKKDKSCQWVFDLLPSNEYVIVTKPYMRHYLAGYEVVFEGQKYIQESQWKKILDAGDFNRVVLDYTGEDGFFYNSENNPVLRAFQIDYIYARLGSNEYDLNKLAVQLRKQEGVTNVNIVEVPYEFVRTIGDYAIEFDFIPSPMLFKRMVKNAHPNSCAFSTRWRTHVLNKVGIKKYRR